MKNQQKTITPRVVLQMLFFVVVIPFLPLLISWRWNWWEAWIYAIIGILGFAISRVLAARRHPDLIAERARYMRMRMPSLGISDWPLFSGLAVFW